MEFKTIISAKGELMLPKAIMQTLGLKPEDEVTLSVKKGNALEIQTVKKPAAKEAANTSEPGMEATTLIMLESSFL